MEWIGLDECNLGDDCNCHLTGNLHMSLKDAYAPDCHDKKTRQKFGNGLCNKWLNNAECLYDGGDCCLRVPVGDTELARWLNEFSICSEDNVTDPFGWVGVYGSSDPYQFENEEGNFYSEPLAGTHLLGNHEQVPFLMGTNSNQRCSTLFVVEQIGMKLG